MKAKQLPSGNYRVQLVVGYDDNGKRIVKSFTAPTEWDALKQANDYKEGRVIDPKHITVRQALDNYIESRQSIIAPSTKNGYTIIINHRLQSIKDCDIHTLDRLTIQRAINIDVSNGLKHKSIKEALALLRSACSYYDVAIPPTNQFTLPPKENHHNELPELSDVLNAVIGTKVELPSLLSLWCGGMRMSEVRGLQYRDITTDKSGNHYISINRSRVYAHGQDWLKETNKTYNSTRKIPLPDYLYNMIKSKAHNDDNDFIINESYNTIKCRYDRIMERHGLHITFHDLRALFATQMNELGVQKEILQTLGGWTNSKVLDSVYIRHSDNTLCINMNLLTGCIMNIIGDENSV